MSVLRITQQTLDSRVLADLRLTQARAAQTQQQISSQKRIGRPSDDPFGTHVAIDRRRELDEIKGYQSTADGANAWTQASDGALRSVSDLIQRARELTIEASNGTADAKDRQIVTQELTQIINSVKDLANTKHGDEYIFAGTATTTPPYTTASDTYNGDAGVVARTVGPGVSVQVNTLGSAIFGSGQAAADGKLLNTLRDIVGHLQTNNVGALQTTDLQNLAANLDSVTGALATNGAAQSRLDAASARLGDMEQTTTSLLGDVEDVDLADAITTYSSQQAAYQAALKTGASIIQPSLLDFLR